VSSSRSAWLRDNNNPCRRKLEDTSAVAASPFSLKEIQLA